MLYHGPAENARGAIIGLVTDRRFLEELAAITADAGRLGRLARGRMVKELKPDGSVVTNGDREVETFLRLRLPSLHEAPIWGEEFGYEAPSVEGQWLLDPIDGTSNYALGSPLWGVSVALAQEGKIVAGCVVLPDLEEVFVAGLGAGVMFNDRPLDKIPSGAVQRHDLVGYCESVSRLGLHVPGRQRCTGAFVVEGTWVMTQRFRGMLGVRERLYDVAACILMGQELGADVRYADGSDLDVPALQADVRIDKPWAIFPANSGFLP